MISRQEQNRIWWQVHHEIEGSAKEAGVPFWRHGDVFQQACGIRLSKMRESRFEGLVAISPDDFMALARKATALPVIRPDGDEGRSRELARALCHSVVTVLEEIDGMAVAPYDSDASHFPSRDKAA